MKTLCTILAAAALASLPLAASGQPAGNAKVWARIQELIGERFYDPQRAKRFAELKLPGAPTDEAMAKALAGLGASHTARYRPDQIDYYELADIYRFAIAGDIKRMFPPDGQVTYPGIGLIVAPRDGRLFVSESIRPAPPPRPAFRSATSCWPSMARPMPRSARSGERSAERSRLP